MTFIQTIELRTKKFDEIRALEEQWLAATDGRRTLKKAYVTRDRNDTDRYVIVAMFDSYDDAMKNSSLPETSEFAQKQAVLADGPMSFADFDVVDEIS